MKKRKTFLEISGIMINVVVSCIAVDYLLTRTKSQKEIDAIAQSLRKLSNAKS